MRSTSAEALSIHAVSPRSIFDPAGADGAGAAGAALLVAAVGCWARTALAVAPRTSTVSRARVSRFTRVSLLLPSARSAPGRRRIKVRVDPARPSGYGSAAPRAT